MLIAAPHVNFMCMMVQTWHHLDIVLGGLNHKHWWMTKVMRMYVTVLQKKMLNFCVYMRIILWDVVWHIQGNHVFTEKVNEGIGNIWLLYKLIPFCRIFIQLSVTICISCVFFIVIWHRSPLLQFKVELNFPIFTENDLLWKIERSP